MRTRSKPRWKSKPLGLVYVFFLCGCSPAATGDTSPQPTWSEGRYRLSAVVTYRDDLQSGTRTERREIWGELSVGPEGPISMDSSEGLCRRPDHERASELAVRRHTFLCDDATFSVQPASMGVRGTLALTVMENIRVEAGCAQYQRTADGREVCVRTDYRLRTNRATKREAVRVIRLRR